MITSKNELSTKGKLLLSLWQNKLRTAAEVQAAVTAGKITQDECDFILLQPQEN